MDMKIPTQPSINPADDSRAGLNAWTTLWREYRDEIATRLMELLDRHDNARELVHELQQFCRVVAEGSPVPRQWKRDIVSKGPDQFYIRHYENTYERDLVTRSPDGHWAIVDLDEERCARIGEEDALLLTAKLLLSSLMWWGDLNAIYLAKSYLGPASFVPPEGCD